MVNGAVLPGSVGRSSLVISIKAIQAATWERKQLASTNRRQSSEGFVQRKHNRLSTLWIEWLNLASAVTSQKLERTFESLTSVQVLE